ncbi:MAG: CoA transferase, partial [Dehalococcoidia bacterium]|nr:CoA transferase [Dehalococcoidia bacterium]
FIGCATVNFGELRRLSDFVCPELDDETMFGDFFWGSTAHADDLEAMLVPCFFEHKREEIVDIAQGRGLPWSYVANTRDLVEANPHLKARGSLVEMEHPRAGKLLYFVPCNRFSEIGTRLLPAPFLGQHNEEIFGGWLGLTKNDITKLAEAGII